MPLPHFRHSFWTFALVILFSRAGAAQPANPLELKPHHATAAVADLDRAVRWYEQMLGFKVLDRGDRPNGMKFADLELPGYGIGLVQKTGPPPSATSRGGWV